MQGMVIGVIALTAAAVFVLVTGQDLPPRVASHFDGSGVPNGFSTRASYLVIFLAILGVPALLVLAPRMLRHMAPGAINLPNRDYWLAPERREASFAYLERHFAVLAAGLLLFLCAVHWLVVQANRAQPPRLPNDWFLAALGTVVIGIAWWLLALYRRFRRP